MSAENLESRLPNKPLGLNHHLFTAAQKFFKKEV